MAPADGDNISLQLASTAPGKLRRGQAGYHRGVSPGGAGGGRRRGMGLGEGAPAETGPEGMDTRGGGGVACRRAEESVRAGGPTGLPPAGRAAPPPPADASPYDGRRPPFSGDAPLDIGAGTAHNLMFSASPSSHQPSYLQTDTAMNLAGAPLHKLHRIL